MDRTPHLLVVDDDREIRSLVAQFLTRHGYRVTGVKDGAEMMRALETARVDLIVLDLMLPGEDGLSLCRRLRAAPDTAQTPVIMLTAMGEETDRIVGLEMGADDYLAKPFDPRELVLRINNILKRHAPADTPKIEQVMFGPYTFSITRKELKKASELIRLTDREQEIKQLFALRAGDTIPRHELVGSDTEVGERTIDVQINRLRRKIEDDPANPIWLQTVRGIGYRLSID